MPVSIFNSWRGLCEQRFYFLLELFGEQYALDRVPHIPAAVYDDRDRQRLGSGEEAPRCFRAEREGVIDAETSREAPNFTRRFRRVRHAYDPKPLPSVVALHLHQARHLGAARRAPRGPKIQEHYFALVVAQAKAATLDTLERERRSFPRALTTRPGCRDQQGGEADHSLHFKLQNGMRAPGKTSIS
jgi:hypothetical protein